MTEWRWTDERGVQRLVGTEELRAALSSQVLPLTTLVWREGMKEWAPASSVPELASAVGGSREVREVRSKAQADVQKALPPAAPQAAGGQPQRAVGAKPPPPRREQKTLLGMPSPDAEMPSAPPSMPIVVPSAGGSPEPGRAVITQIPKFGAPDAEGKVASPTIPRAPRLPAPSGLKERPKPLRKLTTSDIDGLWAKPSEDDDYTQPMVRSPELQAALKPPANDRGSPGPAEGSAAPGPAAAPGAQSVEKPATPITSEAEPDNAGAAIPLVQAPKGAADAPLVSAEAPRVVAEEPPIVAETKAAAAGAPTAAAGAPTAAADAPTAAPEAPPTAVGAPPAVVEAPPAVVEAPPAAVEAPESPAAAAPPATVLEKAAATAQPAAAKLESEKRTARPPPMRVTETLKLGALSPPTGARTPAPPKVADPAAAKAPLHRPPSPATRAGAAKPTLKSPAMPPLKVRPPVPAPAERGVGAERTQSSMNLAELLPEDDGTSLPRPAAPEGSETPRPPEVAALSPLSVTMPLPPQRTPAAVHEPPALAESLAALPPPPPMAAPLPFPTFSPLPPLAPPPATGSTQASPGSASTPIPPEAAPAAAPAAHPSTPPPRFTPPASPVAPRFAAQPPLERAVNAAPLDDDDLKLTRQNMRQINQAVAVPVSSLLGAGGALIFMVIGAFFVGRCSAKEPPPMVARPVFHAVPAMARASLPPPPKPCWVVRQPVMWAPKASKSIPFDVVPSPPGALAVGYARDGGEAVGIEVSAATGEVHQRFNQKIKGEIDRVTPMSAAEFRVVTAQGGGALSSAVPVPAAKPFFVGIQGGAIAAADRPDAAATALWPLSGGEGISAARVQLAGDRGYAITFRREGAIWGGWIGPDRKAVGALTKVAGSGGSVGKPNSGWNRRELAVIFADKPDGNDHWQIRIGHALGGQVPAATAVIPLPKGGPGGDAFAPDIAGLPDGRWLMVWTEGPAGSRAIRAQTLAFDFSPLGDPIALSPPAGNFGQGVLGVVENYAGAVFLSKGSSSYELWGSVLQCG